MNKVLKYIPVFAVAVLLWTGCQKEKTVLPEREISEEVSDIADKYNKILVAAPDGWVIGYKPDNYDETVYVSMRFAVGQKVGMQSGYRNYHTLQNGLDYSYEGKHVPVIVFSENTVFATLAGLYNGSQKFKISYIEDGGYFELTRSDGYDNKTFKLEKASTANTAQLNEQIADVLAQIAYEEEQARLSEQTRLKIKSFVEISSDFYFYNIKTEHFSAAITKLDTTLRQLSLTYKESSISAPKSVTVGYTVYPKGIKLSPAISYGNVLVDEIELGDLTNPVLDIVKAGNAGAGKMGYMHEAPYAYTNVSNRTETIAQLLYYNSRESNNFLYTTLPDSLYSQQALIHREQLRQKVVSELGHYTDTRFNFQLYFPPIAIPATNSMSLQVTARNAANSANTFYALYLSLEEEKLKDNVLKFALNGNASASTAGIRTDCEALFSALFPEEGVTVVPYRVGTTTRFKLVSKKDSRIWVNYIHQLAAPRGIVYN